MTGAILLAATILVDRARLLGLAIMIAMLLVTMLATIQTHIPQQQR
jgi:hypothetical protein